MILALCPSRGRPEAALAVLASFLETRRDSATRLVFLVDADDPRRKDYPQEYTMHVAPSGSMGGVLRSVVHDRGLLRDASAVGVIGDDVRFRTVGWDKKLDKWLSDKPGIAWGDDGWEHPWPKEQKASHWWLSRPIVDAMGLCPANMQHWFFDDYWAQLAWAVGCARYFPDLLFEHLHPMAGKAVNDRTYERSARLVATDRRWWAKWQRSGKEADIRRLRNVVRADDTRRIFADWHHPALWESLRILFEDRFGWELYSPIGAQWKERGWRFTHEDWRAEDYLVFPDARLVGDHYEHIEAEYPLHPRKLVTVQQADAMTWDFVLASVSSHQYSFGQLARDWGARLIYQVGNAKQPVDKIADVVLASATVPRGRPRQMIQYHQEFDRQAFSFSRPTSPDRISSFMMRLDSASCDYHWLADAEGVRWSSFGGVDPHAKDYLSPMSRVADEMRGSGWVWHDKKIGDGYGHVLHNAAAMGRPLIGHASHYTGRLGEPFWRDLKTCIDLDRHEPAEALRLLRHIGHDPDWHAEMSANIAAEFAKRVDFDAEADQIKAVLA